MVCQIDLLTSLATPTRRDPPREVGPDGLDVLPALLGDSPTGRDHLVEQAAALAIRQGRWKLISRRPPSRRPAAKKKVAAKKADNGPAPELFDLAAGPAETNDLAARHPDEVKQLSRLLERIRQDERSRPVR